MKNQYYVGELAKFFGVSRDTIRLYDKMGIISPEKDIKNNYRIYTREDFICLDYVMRLRKMNLSLEDIKILINDSTIEHAEALMQIQESVIVDKIEDLKHLLTMVQDYKKSFGNVIRHLGEIHITNSPVFISRSIDSSMIDTMEAFSNLTKSHVPKFTFICKKDIFLSDVFVNDIIIKEKRKDLFYSAITLVDDENYSKKVALKEKGFDIFHSRKCVHSVGKNYTNKNYDAFLAVRDYIIENNLQLVDDILFRTISIRNDSKNSVDYYELWAPIA